MKHRKTRMLLKLTPFIEKGTGFPVILLNPVILLKPVAERD